MKATLTLALLAAALGGCAIVPYGYDDGYYGGYHRDRDYRDYRGDRFDRDQYRRHDRWWRYDDRGRYYGDYGFRYRDHGQ